MEKIDLILSQGANINYQEEHTGYTGLICAADKGFPNIARHLIIKGAHVHIKEEEGYNAYTMAKKKLDKYTSRLQSNETEELSEGFTAEQKAEKSRIVQ